MAARGALFSLDEGGFPNWLTVPALGFSQATESACAGGRRLGGTLSSVSVSARDKSETRVRRPAGLATDTVR